LRDPDIQEPSINPLIDNPFAVFAIALVTQWGAAFVGDLLRRRIRPLNKDQRGITRDSCIVVAARWSALGFTGTS
jgi:hypothetical protein